MSRLLRFVVVVGLAGLLTATAVALVAPQIGSVLTAGDGAPVSELDLDDLAQRSVVYAADGSVIGVLHAEINRVEIPLTDVPQHVIDAVLAVEDEDFYQHNGVNLRATLRALATNVSEGEVSQGGSTITQQLIKNTLLTPRQSIGRKVREANLAIRLERQMSKDEILERYLNTVYLGNGAYGFQAAAEVYFGIDAKSLDIAQAAFLAGVIRNPEGYNPFRNPEDALERRDLIVDRLVDVDQLTEDEGIYIKAIALPTQRLDLRPDRDYFLEEVQRRLLADVRMGDTQEERYDTVFRGGLTIRTTLDPHLQDLARMAVATELPDTGGRFSAAVVSVEPSTGAVRAIVGGPGFEQSQFNLATDGIGRQPGSSFKPFVLAAALEAGYSPLDSINGSGPCRFDPEDYPGVLFDEWNPGNYEGTSGGVGTLYSVTARSLNCAYARLGLLIGPEKAAEMARRLGITTPIPPDPSIALGAREVHPLDMAGAFATFAADGVRHDPYLVEEVTDRDGNVLLEGRSGGLGVISPEIAATVTDVLQGVVRSGTGTAASLGLRPVAGKTGTSNENANAWFVGYTPQLSTAVWMGSPLGNVPMLGVGGVRAVTGGSFPARIWHAFMDPALAGSPIIGFPAAPFPEPGEYLEVPARPEVQGRSYERPSVDDDPVVIPTVPPATFPPATDPPTTTPPTTSPPTTSPPTTLDPGGGDGGEGDGDGGTGEGD